MEPIILDLVEYEPSTRADRIAHKANQEYCGVADRASDGFTCLSIRSPGSTRRHHIQVGQVEAITLNGVRHVLETPWGRHRIRAQEIVKLIEGDFSDDWAREYFDPQSPKFYKREAGYEPARNTQPKQTSKDIAPSTDSSGCTVLAAVIIVASLMVWFW